MYRLTGIIALLLTVLTAAASAQVFRDGDRFRNERRDGRDYRPDGGFAGDWVRIGCRDVDLFGTDRDTIRVGDREGRFRALRVHVLNAGIDLIDLRVIYTNGEPDHLAVGRYFRPGDYSEPLDLRGRGRFIDRVELVYRSVFRGAEIVTGQRVERARVCVTGLQRER